MKGHKSVQVKYVFTDDPNNTENYVEIKITFPVKRRNEILCYLLCLLSPVFTWYLWFVLHTPSEGLSRKYN